MSDRLSPRPRWCPSLYFQLVAEKKLTHPEWLLLVYILNDVPTLQEIKSAFDETKEDESGSLVDAQAVVESLIEKGYADNRDGSLIALIGELP